MSITPDQKSQVIGLVRRRYPEWDGFEHRPFLRDEINAKRLTVKKATALLSESTLAHMLVTRDTDSFIERLERLGKATTLLERAGSEHGDLEILYVPTLDKPVFCAQIYHLLHGTESAQERLAAYLRYVEDHELPNSWTFPTYLLFFSNPRTEFLVEPQATEWFLKYIGLSPYLGKPSPETYLAIKEFAHGLKHALAEYRPQDMIDIQSLVRVCAAMSQQPAPLASEPPESMGARDADAFWPGGGEDEDDADATVLHPSNPLAQAAASPPPEPPARPSNGTARPGTPLDHYYLSFIQTYMTSPAGVSTAVALSKAREKAEQHFAHIVAEHELGEVVTERVFLHLLPHSDSAEHAASGAWIHPMPAIDDALNALSRLPQHEREQAAVALLELTRQCVYNPKAIAAHIKRFSESGHAGAFMSRHVTPLLHALKPSAFIMATDDAIATINFFGGTELTNGLRDFPLANEAGHALIRYLHSNADSLGIKSIQDTDLFALFCTWFVAQHRQRQPATPSVDVANVGAPHSGDGGPVKPPAAPAVARDDTPGTGQHAAPPADEPALDRADADVPADANPATPEPDDPEMEAPGYDAAEAKATGDEAPAAEAPASDASGENTPEVPTLEDTAPEPTASETETAETETPEYGTPDIEMPPAPEASDRHASEPANDETATDEPEPAERAPVDQARDEQAPGELDAIGPETDVDAGEHDAVGPDAQHVIDEIRDTVNALDGAAEIAAEDDDPDSTDRSDHEPAETAAEAIEATEEPRDEPVAETPQADEADAPAGDPDADAQDGAEPAASPIYLSHHYMPDAADEVDDDEVAEESNSLERVEGMLQGVGRDPLEACAAHTGFSVSELTSWIETIRRKKQVIICGPPGAGKTFLARHLARYLAATGEGFVETLQFHPGYTYDDFIGLQYDAARLQDRPAMGHFTLFCEKAARRNGECVMMIDEINRADLNRVLGELVYLLEYRDESLSLAGGRTLRVPGNAYLIGTMSAIAGSAIDPIVRRRFAFIYLPPRYDILQAFLERSGYPADPLIAVLNDLNDQIDDPNRKLGIAYFMRENLGDQLEDIWLLEVEPWLEACFAHQPERLAAYRWPRVKERLCA